MIDNPSENTLRTKMNSDQTLNSIQESIAYIVRKIEVTNEDYIAGAIVIKHMNKVYLLISGYDMNFKCFSPNYFLHYNYNIIILISQYFFNNFFIFFILGISFPFLITLLL